MKAKTPTLTPQQKAQILGDDDIDKLAGHLAIIAAKGGYVLPLTALSRRTSVLLGYCEKAGRSKIPAKGTPVLTFVI